MLATEAPSHDAETAERTLVGGANTVCRGVGTEERRTEAKSTYSLA